MNKNKLNRVDTLLILGNGFDLNCGLKSRFSDYYEYKCKKKLEEVYENFKYGKYYKIREILKNNSSDINFWSFLLYINYYSDNKQYIIINNREKNWFNIEKFILEALRKKWDRINDMNSLVKRGVAMSENNFDLLGNTIEIQGNPFILFPIIQKIKYMKPIDYLLNELRKFENSFKDYLKRIINEKYKQNSKLLLSALLSNYSDVDIINFNYTNVDDCNKVHKQFNVHGSLEDDEIIIGIDTLATEDDLNNIIFTKTYRNLHRLKEKLELPKNIDHLVFYGHSLAEADFSYFYSLFDMYHLYDSKLDLTFYYSDYEENDENNKKNHSNYVKNVYNLINKYSTKSKGETNLLHRLLLEGRIIISKLDDTDINYLDPSEG